MTNISDENSVHVLLSALGEHLAQLDEPTSLVIIGGSGLLAIGAVERVTRDIDVVALLEAWHLIDPRPFSEGLKTATKRVAADFSVGEDWLNAGPADLLRFGLPSGFSERLEARSFGPALTAHFASRFDQIHFKLFAVVDQGPGKHSSDLEALEPSEEEFLSAARWARTHDPSPGFKEVLLKILSHYGVDGELHRV